MAFEVVFRERLPQDVLDELDQHNATLSGYLDEEHNEDGSHADITADSVTVRPGGTVELADGAALRVIDGVPTLVSEGPELALATRADPALPSTHESRDNVVEVSQGPLRGKRVALTDALLSVQRLCLFPQSSYEAAFADTAAFADSVGGPRYSVYRVTGGNIEGIYSILESENGSHVWGRGQVLVLINDKDTPLNLAHLGAVGPASPRKIIGGPLYIDPDGAALLVYDDENEGWQIVGSHGTAGKWQPYTPSWTSSGTQPNLGNGTLTGQYTLIGDTCHFNITLTFGSTTSFGTGTHRLSLPQAVHSSFTNTMHKAFMFDADGSPTRHEGIGILDGSSTAVLMATASADSITSVRLMTSTTPFTWATGDFYKVCGFYRIA